MFDAVCGEVMTALKQQEANFGRSVRAVLEWGVFAVDCVQEGYSRHEKVVLVMRMSTVLGALVSP